MNDIAPPICYSQLVCRKVKRNQVGNLIENLIDIYPIMGCRMFGLMVR